MPDCSEGARAVIYHHLEVIQTANDGQESVSASFSVISLRSRPTATRAMTLCEILPISCRCARWSRCKASRGSSQDLRYLAPLTDIYIRGAWDSVYILPGCAATIPKVYTCLSQPGLQVKEVNCRFANNAHSPTVSCCLVYNIP